MSTPPSVLTCRVCGDKATIQNYGALTCSSCKTFFRRIAFRPKNISPCILNGSCEMTVASRRTCGTCRLAKCLAVGMCPDLIRKEDLSKQKRSLILRPSPQLPTLNLLCKDLSSLKSSDWTLLSNVVHAFDRYTPVPTVRLIIENLPRQSGIEQSRRSMSMIYSALESFIYSTADFQIMTIAEQKSLIERNMHGLWSVYGSLTFRESGVFDNEMNEVFIQPLYGTSNVQKTKRMAKQFDYDLTFLKLMLMTLTFSSNLFTITATNGMGRDSLLYGTFRILGSQNVYVEIAWNYMIYRYGFEQSVRRFASYIKTILNIIQLTSDINESNTIHQQLADDMLEQTERSLNLNTAANAPLWGKT